MNARLLNIVCPAITFLLVLAAWVGYRSHFQVPDYILPSPGAVWNAVTIAYTEGFIYRPLMFTTQAMVLGYIMGCGAGLLLGGLVAESRLFERFVYPYVIIIQSMPKVALAPLIIVWFGFGIESKIVMVTLICFFPVFVNTVAGIRQAVRDMIDVLRASSASRLRIFFHVKVPSAVTTVFAGLQIAIVLGLIGAVVAEFVASKEGIGTLIQSAAVELNTAMMLTGVFTLAVMGLIGSSLVRLLHRKVAFWEAPEEGAPNAESA